MKKLLDETTDDLTRALLVAGVEHRPPVGNKAQLIVALGAGSAVGLFSTKAFAWLSTSAGKVTLLGVALGVSGAVYAVVPLLDVSDTSPQASAVSAPAEDDRTEDAVLQDVVERRAQLSPAPAASQAALPQAALPQAALPQAALPEPAAAPGELADGEGLTPADAIEPLPVGSFAVTDRSGASSPAAKPQKKTKATSKLAVSRARDKRSGPLPAVEAPPAVGALADLSATEPQPSAEVGDRSRLDAEVRLVDDMHWAARGNDREALGRFVETYRLQFPDGQLKEEVAKFAARLERPSKH